MNEKNKDLIKKNEDSMNKFERLKEKISEKENVYMKLIVEKNQLDAKFEKISKEASDEMKYLNSMIEKQKQEKENIAIDLQILFKKNEEFKLKYEELTILNNELIERNKNLERLSKINHKTLEEYGTIQNNDGTPLDKIYTTYSSMINPEVKEERRKTENFTVQMEVNIAKINKNPGNLKVNLNQTNIVQGPSSPSKINELQQKEELNKNASYIANLLEDQCNVIQIDQAEYSENENSEIQQTENSILSQEDGGEHGSNNYSTGNIVYTSNNYDSLRNFQPRLNQRYDSEENNNYNSIRGENYTSGVSGAKH